MRIASRIWPIQLLILCALEVDLRPAICGQIRTQVIGQPLRIIKRAGPADIVLHQIVELGLERGVGLGRAIFTLQIEDQRHQRFGDVASAKLAEMAPLVRLVAIGIGDVVHERRDWQTAPALSSLPQRVLERS